MPNQYTKFQAASQDPASRAFTWREWTGKKQKRGRGAKKQKNAIPPAFSEDDNSSTSLGSHASSPGHNGSCNLLQQYLPSGGLRVDPFSAYPISPDRQEMAVLDHYFYILVPSGKLNNRVFRPRSFHIDPHVNLLLPFVMHDSTLFDAMLAGCQASITLSTGLSTYSDRFFMLHRGRAMSGLRKKLQAQPDTSTFLSIALLITCDYLLGDLTAVTGHTRALRKMVSIWGQLPETTTWEKFVKQGIEAYMYIGCMATGMASEGQKTNALEKLVDPFLELEYPERPFSATSSQSWANLPSGILELILSSQVSTQLCAIITTFDEVSATFSSDGLGNIRILHPIHAALQRFSQHPQATYIERCLAAGLFAYTFQFPRVQIPNLFHDPPMLGMLRLFSVSYQWGSRIERELLIWAVMASSGFIRARISPLPASKHTFVQFTAREPLMRDWPSVERILRRFLFTPSLLDRWKICHDQIMSEYESRKMSTVESGPNQGYTNYTSNETSQSSPVCPVTGQTLEGSTNGINACPFFKTTNPS